MGGLAERVAGGEQAEHGPRCLRGSAITRSLQIRVVIRAEGFTPTVVRVLHHAQPLGGLLDHGLILVDAYRIEPAQHLHGAVDVIHAPAAEPGAILLLFFADELHSVLYAAIFL